MYTGIFAFGAYIISTKTVSSLIHIDIFHFIVGSVLSVSTIELWLLGIVTSMFTAIMGTRAVVNLIYGGQKRVKKLNERAAAMNSHQPRGAATAEDIPLNQVV